MEGFAGSKASTNPSFEKWKTGIATFIKDYQIEKPIIIGHSMGGGLAMAIAADYPDIVGKIVVVDALPYLAVLTNPTSKPQENLDCSSNVSYFTSLPDDQFHSMQKATMPQLMQNMAMQETLVNWSMQTDRATFATMYCDFLNTDLREKISTITCQTLVLLESFFKPLKPQIDSQFTNLKNAQLQYANKGLHFIMYDDTTWYLNQLENFIR